MVKLHWDKLEASNSLSQAINGGLEFCFVSADNHQCSPLAYCKDYLQDAILGRVRNKKESVYGFTYDPKEPHQPCIDITKLAFANSSDKNLRDKVPALLEFLHQIETKMGFVKKSSIVEVSNPPKKYVLGGVWIITASRRWLKSPVLLSMYTLLIRVGLGHKPGRGYAETLEAVTLRKEAAYQSVDAGRLQYCNSMIHKIIELGDRHIFGKKIKDNYPAKVKTIEMHNELGIVAFALGSAKKHVPKWYERLETKPEETKTEVQV
jgi:hypothetical protein